MDDGHNKRCAGCQNIFYCSSECQRLDRQRHKGECKRWKLEKEAARERELDRERAREEERARAEKDTSNKEKKGKSKESPGVDIPISSEPNTCCLATIFASLLIRFRS